MEKFKKKFRQWSAHLGVILVVVVWGSTFVSSKVLLNEGLMPADIFFYRFLMAYACLFLLYPKLLFSQSWRDELVFLGLGLMGGSLYFLTENMALVYSTSSNVSILITSCPMLTALIVGFFYRSERVNRKQFLGSVIAFVGSEDLRQRECPHTHLRQPQQHPHLHHPALLLAGESLELRYCNSLSTQDPLQPVVLGIRSQHGLLSVVELGDEAVGCSQGNELSLSPESGDHVGSKHYFGRAHYLDGYIGNLHSYFRNDPYPAVGLLERIVGEVGILISIRSTCRKAAFNVLNRWFQRVDFLFSTC